MRAVKHLKICLTIGTQTSAEIAPLQYTIINTAPPYTHISHSTGYAIASVSSRESRARINLIDCDYLKFLKTRPHIFFSFPPFSHRALLSSRRGGRIRRNLSRRLWKYAYMVYRTGVIKLGQSLISDGFIVSAFRPNRMT